MGQWRFQKIGRKIKGKFTVKKYFKNINTALDVLILISYIIIRDLFKWSLVILIQILALILALLGLMTEGTRIHNEKTLVLLKLLTRKMEDFRDEFDKEN